MPGGVTGQHLYYSLSIHIVINLRKSSIITVDPDNNF